MYQVYIKKIYTVYTGTCSSSVKKQLLQSLISHTGYWAQVHNSHLIFPWVFSTFTYLFWKWKKHKDTWKKPKYCQSPAQKVYPSNWEVWQIKVTSTTAVKVILFFNLMHFCLMQFCFELSIYN